MIKNLILKSYNWLLLAIVLPVVYGCNNGGTNLGSLFGGPQNAASLGSGGGDSVLASAGGNSVGTITNPEPTTMLLLGSGMIAMAYYKNRFK